MQQYQRLTARQLGAINDTACALILDPYIGVNSRKLFYRPPVKNQSKLKHIVQRLVDGQLNEDKALALLLARDETQRKVRQLTTYLELNEKQIGQYFRLYLAAFRSSPTNFRMETCDQYTSTDGKPGLRIVATRSFEVNDIIPSLVGLVASTLSADADNKNNKSKSKTIDHGLTSSNSGQQMHRSKPDHLLLGPVAFVNHSCEPNASMRKLKDGRIILSVASKIQAGDEITVNYGCHYPGEDDQDDSCDCQRCITKNKYL